MIVILTSKPGQFHTESCADTRVIESWDYLFCGKLRTHFAIAELLRECKVRVVDDTGPVNLVPSKFLERFETVEAARASLKQLVNSRNSDTALVVAQA